MKSPVFAIAALATLTAAMEGSMFVAVHKRDVGFSPMNLGMRLRRDVRDLTLEFCFENSLTASQRTAFHASTKTFATLRLPAELASSRSATLSRSSALARYVTSMVVAKQFDCSNVVL